MKGWIEYSLSDAIDFNPKVKLQKGETYAQIEMEDVEPSARFIRTIKTIEFDGNSGSKFKDGDILFARITPCLENRKIGQAKIPETKYGVGSTEFFVIRAKEGFNHDFLFYLMKTEYVVENAVNSMFGASGRQRADLDFIKKIKLRLPPLPIQTQIADILGRYDALIENCEQQITALEATAREVYREWFVRGRCPGENVEEWERGRYTDVISILSGGTPKTEIPQYWDGDVHWFSPADTQNNYYVISTGKTITTEGLQNCNSKLYPTNTVVITARGTVGRVVLLGKPMAINQSNYALVGKSVPQSFVFFKTQEVADQFKQVANGAVFDTITIDTFERTSIVIPPMPILKKFDSIIITVFAKILLLHEQIETLRTTRDKLLPRLLTGKLKTITAQP